MVDCYRKIFNRDGYVHIKNFFSEEEGSMIQKIIDDLFKYPEIPGKYMKYYETANNGRQLSRIEYFIKYNTNMKKIFDDKVQPLINNLCQEKMCLFKDKVNWKLGGGNGFKAHQDFPAWSDFPPKYFLTVAMFGDKCTQENGCLEMVSGYHNKGILSNTYENGGGINDNIVKSLVWKPVLSNIRDIVIFDSFTPHKSEANTTQESRRICYFTFNKECEGNYYEDYFKKKREMLPPDIEKDHTKVYNENSKYNLANPISYSKL